MTKLIHRRTYSIINLGEAFYSNAKMMQWTGTDECNNLVIMVGGFKSIWELRGIFQT